MIRVLSVNMSVWEYEYVDSLTHTLTHTSLTQSLTHSLTHRHLTYSLTHHSHTHSLTHVNKNFAFESWSWWVSSLAVYNGLQVVMIPPMDITPNSAIANSGRFGEYIANTSPFTNFRRVKPAPHLLINTGNSLNLMVLPLGSTRATRSPKSLIF